LCAGRNGSGQLRKREHEMNIESNQAPAMNTGDRRLVAVGEVARRLSISIRQTWKLVAAGKLPAPIRLGRSVRWRAAELDSWIGAGCPEVGRESGAGAVR
jgi:excisionase family DNA binding protein